MLSIAGGIILALLILAFLPEFFLLIIYIFGIALAVFIFLLVFGLLSDSNFADVIATLTLFFFLGLSYFLHDTYIQSRNLRLFSRKLILLATLTLSPKKQVEKEVRLQCLQQDIVLHCENKNLAIKNKLPTFATPNKTDEKNKLRIHEEKRWCRGNKRQTVIQFFDIFGENLSGKAT